MGSLHFFQVLQLQLQTTLAAIFIDIQFIHRVDLAATQPIFWFICKESDGVDQYIAERQFQHEFQMLLADDAALIHVENAVERRFRKCLPPNGCLLQLFGKGQRQMFGIELPVAPGFLFEIGLMQFVGAISANSKAKYRDNRAA